ncbi:hypothetical protein DdX_18220 [Ditylenchus destructor]|uniref:F-box domain-containing protein n=1 Tax=Ditylenchus destructor TaxID=166010 RepID=A0AAD4ML67_9BILA|nr:hypothetical protein DdX_18220 [Ditylenchus destructor]
MSLLPSDILREVLAYCDRFDLNELTQSTRQLNQVIQTSFREKPFMPINSLVHNPGATSLSRGNKTSKYFQNVWQVIENGLGEKFFRVRRMVLFFSNGIEIDKTTISRLEKIFAMATNSEITIIFARDSVFTSEPKTLSPLTDLLSVVTPKCDRLTFDLIYKAPIDYSFPLLQYPALLQYKEIEFSDAFAKYLNKDDVIEFLHQKAENHRMNQIRLRIMFPAAEWAERLIHKIVKRFEQATEISPPFQLQLCLSKSVSMKFGPLFLKNSKTGEILRYTISNYEELPDTSLHTIERAPEFK